MTTAVVVIAPLLSTQPVDNPHMTMTSNDVLNVLLQGFLDEDCSMVGEEDDCIDDDGAVDDDKLEDLMDRQEAENERKRNLLVSMINIVELEDQEHREADAVYLRRHREQFPGQQREKRRKGKRQWYFDPIAGFRVFLWSIC
jgi:hypothetical protein